MEKDEVPKIILEIPNLANFGGEQTDWKDVITKILISEETLCRFANKLIMITAFNASM